MMPRKTLLYLLIISTLIFVSCPIKGKIVDGNGPGIAGVTVSLSGAVSMTTTTNSDGNYQFGSLDRGPTYADGSPPGKMS